MNTASNLRIKVTDIVGSSNCVDTVDGHHVNEAISTQLASGGSVILSFEGVGRITTAFLNAAVGQLYNDFTESQIRRQLRFEHVSPISAESLMRVIQRAKEYFANRAKFDAATKAAMDET